jgi:hypothetical protein
MLLLTEAWQPEMIAEGSRPRRVGGAVPSPSVSRTPAPRIKNDETTLAARLGGLVGGTRLASIGWRSLKVRTLLRPRLQTAVTHGG